MHAKDWLCHERGFIARIRYQAKKTRVSFRHHRPTGVHSTWSGAWWRPLTANVLRFFFYKAVFTFTLSTFKYGKASNLPNFWNLTNQSWLSVFCSYQSVIIRIDNTMGDVAEVVVMRKWPWKTYALLTTKRISCASIHSFQGNNHNYLPK